MKTFYTYMWLREDGSVYYVGKGSGDRAFQHRRHRIKPPTDKTRILVQEFPDESAAFFAERLLIAFYGRKDLGTGCLRNLTDGGENPPTQKGIPKTLEHRRKIGEAHKGKKRQPFSAEWLQKLSDAQKIAQLGNKHNLGKRRSPETCKKMSDSMKQHWKENPQTWMNDGGKKK